MFASRKPFKRKSKSKIEIIPILNPEYDGYEFIHQEKPDYG